MCRVGLVVQKGHSVFNCLVINHPSLGPGTFFEPALLSRFLILSGLIPTLLTSALGATKTLGKPPGGRGDHTPGPGEGGTDTAADRDEYRLFSKLLPGIEGLLADLTLNEDVLLCLLGSGRHVVRVWGLWHQPDLHRVSALQLTGSGPSATLPVSPFSCLYSAGPAHFPLVALLWRFNKKIHLKSLAQSLAHSRCSVNKSVLRGQEA